MLLSLIVVLTIGDKMDLTHLTGFWWHRVILSIHFILIDVSGIIEKFNVYVKLAIIPRSKNIKRAC